MQVQSLGQEAPLGRKWQPTPVFLWENSMGRGAWWATVHEFAESDTTEKLALSPSNTDTTIKNRYYHQIQILPSLSIYTMVKSHS